MTHQQGIVGAAELDPGGNIPVSFTGLHVVAAAEALADSGLRPDEVDTRVCAATGAGRD